ncbi:MAG: polysaccharide deacetylase family protein [Acidobacteriota bacterium]
MSPGATATLAAGAAVSAMAWAVRGRSSTVFAPSIWRARPGRKAIALTFDDGPSPATPALLRLLHQYRIPATFFQVGGNVQAYPEVSREVLAGGHEIGNHSQTHPNFALRPPSFITAEFARAQETIAETTGRKPSLLRAPFGVRWFGFRAMQQGLGLTGVMWSIIGRDWKLSAEAIASRVACRAGDGDIICLHDGRGTLKDPDVEPTLEAVRRIIPILLEKGYHFETVTQLLCPLK